METLSHRTDGVLEKVHRCICGAWRYHGNICAICESLRGEKNEQERGVRQDLP